VVTVDGKNYTSDAKGQIKLIAKPSNTAKVTYSYNGQIIQAKILGSNIVPDTQQTQANPFDCMWLILLLILLSGGAGGYYYWHKNKKK
jgi:hypothetical protein